MSKRQRDPATGRFLSKAQIEARAGPRAEPTEQKALEAKEQSPEQRQQQEQPQRRQRSKAQAQVDRIISRNKRQQAKQNKEAKEAKEAIEAIEAKEPKQRAKRIYYRIPTDKKFVSKQRAKAFYESLGYNFENVFSEAKTQQDREEIERNFNIIYMNEQNRRIKEPIIKNIQNKIVEFLASENKKLDINTDEIPRVSFEDIQKILAIIKPKAGYGILLKNGINTFSFAQVNNFLKPEDEQTESEKATVRNIMTNKIFSIIQFKRGEKRRKEGGFFPYLNKTQINLENLGIFSELPNKDYFNENCLVKAFIRSGILGEKLRFILGRTIPQNKLSKIAEILNIQITLFNNTKNLKVINENEALKNVNLALIFGHYFLNEDIKISEFALNNYEEIKHIEEFNLIYRKEVKGDKIYYRKNKDVKISALRCVQLMHQNNLLEPMNESTAGILDTQYYDKVEKKIMNLTNDATKPILSKEELKKLREKNLAIIKQFKNKRTKTTKTTKKPKEEQPKLSEGEATQEKHNKIFFADFETTTDGEKHEAYLLCYSNLTQTMKKTFSGERATDDFFNDLPNDSMVYFHNLGYDFAFLMNNKKLNPFNIIKDGSKVKLLVCMYGDKKFTFKDSYALISEPLRKFASMFKLEMKKEILPYGLYTRESVKNNKVSIASALQHIKPQDKAEFMKLAEDIGTLENIERDSKGNIINADFLHMKYSRFYCLQDVEVLREGMKTFNLWINKAFSIDTFDYVSIPAISKEHLINSGCFKDCYELSGNTRQYIQKCIVGGRVHLPNGSMGINEEMNDLDAVSLYPSAMYKMGFLKGEPKILSPDQLNLTFLNRADIDGYFIQIKNVVVNKRLKSPLQSIIDANGSRLFTNDFKPDETLFIDKIALEDFIKFQGATFDIVNGYYFNEGRNYEIQKTIKEMFNNRAHFKKLDNPIEIVYKLLMNASYGKTIQKPILTDLKFKRVFNSLGAEAKEAKETEDIDIEYNHLIEIIDINEELKLFKTRKPIEDHFNACHIGAEILSMSKRLMNEVMCLAEDLNIEIYYQDTDSMHLKNSDIKKLAEEFEKKYNRVLIGVNLGEFHSDLKIEGAKNTISIGSVFVAKKCYIHKTQGISKTTGEIMQGFHFKMKGASSESVQKLADELYGGDLFKLYNGFLTGATFHFDLLAGGKVSFTLNKDLTYTSKKEFYREISFENIKPTI